ncbi:Mpf1p SKDI_14G1800 [Saccharomyces kudriavzevii IFO 1802]|uniref:Uncharacterized protein n=2 Tax=Saccharomyces kudriavzevii (strain ATCC MYA-4449 / AS 2.2408 / CBS 8840 / NBRC 1802 / NCYC 2889) TaxID=226230 RepID=A0AA35NM87_SACK1|nr:uncharacterized protein SKDI_14G1800 [Saccharomyces kudriavzevii IFO 1802]EJT41467.1 YNL144C-like protein [Saccharomyces kudriavzevii IFO 1802]CAI4049828.1 hypothetical protein SKDI_14G1800 [Saccharomyces kudriavzevii IFO 1802]
MSSNIFGMAVDHDDMDISGLKLSQTASSISMGEEFVCSSNTSASILDSLLPKVAFNHIDSITDIDANIANQISEPEAVLDVGPADNNVLYCIDPYPAEPPCYDLANPSKVIRYPIYEHCRPCLASVEPPSYTPSVEYYTVVSLKMEKASPFENATSRLWNNFILQINSTQINFFFIDDVLTRHIKNYRGGDMVDCSHHPKNASDRHHSARSLLSAFTTKSTHQFDKYDKERMCEAIAQDTPSFLSNNCLYRSYSLQGAKVGLPIDYTSRDFVLRMRCEGQQFLIQFSHVDELINWAMYLNMGISLSLDLELRELPSYRSVPRRRNARRRRRPKRKNKNKSMNSSSENNTRPHALILRRSNTSSVVARATAASERPKSKSRSRSLSLLHPSASTASYDVNGHSTSGSSPAKNCQSDICGLFTSKLRNFFKTDSSSRRNSNMNIEHKRRSSELNSVQEELVDNESATNTTASVVSPTFSPTAHSALTSQSSIHENFRSRSGSNPMDPLHYDASMLKIIDTELSYDGARRLPVSSSTERTIREEELSEDDDDEDDVNYEDDEEEEYGEDYDINRLINLDEGEFHFDSADVGGCRTIFNARNDWVSDSIHDTSSRRGPSKHDHKNRFDDDSKWVPAAQHVSRKRYIKDSLRCIKPLTEDHSWIGKIIFKPAPPPSFETNNPPIRAHSDENSIDMRQMKNHYLKPYIVGSCGLLKTGSRLFHRYDKNNEVTNS